jgi:hypothetical protein
MAGLGPAIHISGHFRWMAGSRADYDKDDSGSALGSRKLMPPIRPAAYA